MEKMPEPFGPITVPEDVRGQQQLSACGAVLGGWLVNPPKGDPYYVNHAQTTLPLLATEGPFRQATLDRLQRQPDIGASQLETLKMRTLQLQFIRRYGDEYPRNVRQACEYGRAVMEIFNDPVARETWMEDVREQDLQSNLAERGLLVKAFLRIAYGLGRLGSGNVVEVGCSQNYIGKKIASGDPFLGVGITGPDGEEIVMPSLIRNARVSTEHSRKLHETINAPVPLGTYLGIDLVSLEESRERVEASLYPSEYEDKEYVLARRRLGDAQYENVKFYQGNYATLDLDDLYRHFPELEGATDITVFPTSAYLSPEPVWRQMLARALETSNEFVVVIDNCVRHGLDGSKLVFLNNWQEEIYPYRAYVVDKKDPTRTMHELFLCTNTRVETIRVGGACLQNAAGEAVQAWDLLRH